MQKLLIQTIYTTIGIASITNEKFKELLEELIQNNHYTEEEGKRIVDDFLVNLRIQVDSFNGNLKQQLDNFLAKFGLPELDSLKEQLENYVTDLKENPTSLIKLP